jgi:8-oxo-dGTP diphosphatase
MDKGYNQPGAWAVIYCAATGKFLMGKRSSKASNSGAWNLFGGRVDSGERPREALVRELGEEAGLSVKPRHLAKLHTFAPRLNREHSDFRWFKAKNLPSKFNEPTWVAIKNGLLDKVARH